MSLSQGDLDAGAMAAIKVFTDAGYGSLIDMDKARGLAAPIIRAVDEYRKNNEWLSLQATLPGSQEITPPLGAEPSARHLAAETKPQENSFVAFIRNIYSQITRGE